MSSNSVTQSPKEELVNWLTHAIGLVLACAGFIFLLNKTTNKSVIVVGIYGGTLMALYLMSTLYHLAKNDRMKRVLRKLDHMGIFLMIAGTYTPFCLIALNELTGLVVLIIVCLLSGAGIFFKVFFTGKLETVSLTIYIVLGWLCLVIIKPVYDSLSLWSFMALVAGGLFYTCGILFYRMRQIKYHHGIWHVFVIAGSTAHYMSILAFV
jgi:hemolysin III